MGKLRHFIIVIFLFTPFQVALAYGDYDSLLEPRVAFNCNSTIGQEELSSTYKAIVNCANKRLCIKTKDKDICFKDEGNDAEEGLQRYSFIGLMANDVAIVNHRGYGEVSDYFISLKTGHTVLTIPPLSSGFSQTSLSVDHQFMIVVTTNNGYDGNPYVTHVQLYELKEGREILGDKCRSESEPIGDSDVVCDKWPQRFMMLFREQQEGEKKYDISWLDNTMVKIQSLNSQNDYIIFHQVKGSWEIKEKSYHPWSDYEYQEDN